MLTDIHPKDPKAARSQIKLPAFGRTHSAVQSIRYTIIKYLKSLKNFRPAKSDPVPATGRIFCL
jgi:hypothetical protein